jgi:diacylglycerol kinase (ATP)
MTATLIVNPVAGSDAGIELLPRIEERLRRTFGPLDVTVTGSPDDAESAGVRAAEAGARFVFVGGGDGTLNDALNGIERAGRLHEVIVGVVPLGTGNDFAYAMGIPDALDDALAVLERQQAASVDVGLLDDRVFVNVSAGGFVADVSDSVSPALKSIAGRLAYLIGGAQALLDFEPIRMSWEPAGEWHVLSTLDDGSEGASRATSDWLNDREVALFAVCNSRLIGGGRLIAPHALVDDGWLDVCVVEAMPTLEFVGLLRQVAAGEHVDDPRVGYARVRDLTCTFDRPARVNTDGEVLEKTRCRYRIRAGGLQVLTGEMRYGAHA